MRAIHASLLLALLASGCAVGNTHGYHDLVAQLAYAGERKVAVATQDQRPYVLNHDKGPQFVGLSRGGYGNPFSVTTSSGKPLADDLSQAIAQSLHAKGFDATPLAIGLGEDDGAVVARAQGTGATRILVLTLREWKSDTMMGTALLYDVSLRVLSPEGAQLATAALTGKDDLGGSALNPPKHARTAVPPAARAKLESLLGEASIVSALR